MRDIKFRAMDLNGHWHYGLLSHITEQRATVKPGYYISNSVGMPLAYQIRPETIGEFTGTKDETGKDIYEGDIVKWHDSYGMENLGDTGFDVIVPVKYEGGAFDPVATVGCEIEVIGNVWQNGELLNPK